MEGHSALYKSVLHHAANTSPVWWLETVGIYTSLLNRCEYSTAHHFAGLSRLLADGPRAEAIYRALAADDPGRVFAGKELALLRYARKLTLAPGEMAESDVVTLRDAGATDEEILETNQVVAYFSYSNRLLNGLGVTTRGDVLGLSPPNSDDLAEWRHA
jgi:uncharacterized peroxidase-related enzyme